MTSTWYQGLPGVGNDVSEEAPGSDFLNVNQLTKEELMEDASIKAIVDNITAHLGPIKISKKNNPEEHRKVKINEFLNIVELAAKLTGNSVHATALPVDVQTVRNFDLVAKGYQLPNFQTNDSSTLMSAFLTLLHGTYVDYCAEDEKLFKEKYPNTPYMQKSDFTYSVKPLIGEIMRYCIKYWLLHPWLSRKEAYAAAIKKMQDEWTPKNNCKKIIEQILNERAEAILMNQVLSLRTVAKEPGSTEQVFEDNESAQMILAAFLKFHAYKVDKNSLDVLVDMKQFIALLGEGIDGQDLLQAKFQPVVPRETAAFLQKKAKAEEKQAKIVRQQKEKEALVQIQMEKKQKLADDLAQKKAQDLENKKAAKAAATAAREAARADAEASGVLPPTLPEEEVEEEETLEESPELMDVTGKTLDITEEYSLYRLPYCEISIERQCHEDFVSKKSKRHSNSSRAKMLEAGIKKKLAAISDGGALIVHYNKPGPVYQGNISARIGNIVTLMLHFDTTDSKLMAALVKDYRQEKDVFSTECGRVMLAIMMHQTAKNDAAVKGLGVHPNYCEENFLQDLVNTKELWLTKLHEQSLIHLHALYRMVCGKPVGRGGSVILGANIPNRREKLAEALDTSPQSRESKKQVAEIIELIQRIDAEIKEGGTNFGKSPGACDPFDTKSLLLDEENDGELGGKRVRKRKALSFSGPTSASGATPI